MNLIFLGPPGAGKGTHAQRLIQKLGVPQISTGDMLRKAMREETPMGVAAKGYVDAGELVPDDVVIAIVRERLAEPDCQSGYILDGFPRTVAQAEALAAFAEIDAALNLVVPDEVIVGRLSGRRVCPKCGGTFHTSMLEGENCPACGDRLIQRKDDMPETVQNRLSVYKRQTEPLIAYYDGKGLLRSADGSHGIEENYQSVLGALGIEA